MLNPNEIHPKHLPSMQAALMKNRSKLDENQVSRLYATAAAVLSAPDAARKDPKVAVSRVVATEGGVVIATCTDVDTGLFVQLSGDPAKGVERAMLSFGKKYCQEVMDTMRQQIATKIW
jgi:hypothetical protein